jgi:hypothetical protein
MWPGPFNNKMNGRIIGVTIIPRRDIQSEKQLPSSREGART